MSGPTVLAFETSCDETGVAVVRGREVLSNVIGSQVDLHARFGGVVPEVAARAHVESIRSLSHRALGEAGVHPDDLELCLDVDRFDFAMEVIRAGDLVELRRFD